MLLKLSQSYIAKIDPKDSDLSSFKWYAWNNGRDNFYAVRNRHQDEPPGPHMIFLHRVILEAQPGQEGDHINGDTLDCRRSNLRLVTRSQNSQNTKMRSSNKSGYRGVSRHISGWQAHIEASGIKYYLGVFRSKVKAARAYAAAAKKLHGSYRRKEYANDR